MVHTRKNTPYKLILLCLKRDILFLVFVLRHVQSVLCIVLSAFFVFNPIIPYQLFSIFDSYECRHTHVVHVLISQMLDIVFNFLYHVILEITIFPI